MNTSEKKPQQPVTGYRKYRFLITSLLLFSLLVVTIMLLSLYVSNQLEKDTKVVNTAFEQSSSVNQTISDLYIINGQYNTGQASSFAQERLQKTMDLIELRLQAFKEGGDLPVVSIGQFNRLDEVTIEAITDTELREKIEEIWSLWGEYQRHVRPALSPISASPQQVYFSKYQFYGSVLHDQGAISGLNRLNLQHKLDRFALGLQKQSDKRLALLRLVQIAGIVITALSLILILFFIVRQLRRSDVQLEKARQEARGILNTVQEGLFLIHEDKTIGSEYSKELESILGTDNIAGNDMSSLMSNIISSQDAKNIDSFLKSLFNPKVVASLIMDLNPLKNLKVQIDDYNGTIKEKYLSFKFYRVTKSKKISDILVSVKDITDKVLLQNKLEATESKNEEQTKALIALMKINPRILQLFLNNTKKALNEVNEIFKAKVSNKSDFHEKIKRVFIRMHTLKGEASAVDLSVIVDKAHAFETELEKLKDVGNIDGMSFLPLTVQLDSLMSYTEDINEIAEKIHGIEVDGPSTGTNTTRSNTSHQEWEHLKKMAQETASQYGKQVNLISCGLTEVDMSDETKQSLNKILVHLIKNSITHGIELPTERQALTKPAQGRIDIMAAQLPDGMIEVSVRDDGQGIDSKKIAQKLVEKGLASQEEVDRWSSAKINKHIFSHGFSTASIEDVNAGRGVGLPAVYEMVKGLQGNLKVKQRINQYCQFSITLPVADKK